MKAELSPDGVHPNKAGYEIMTPLAEAGIAESTMLALLGHMSRAMLERYSHIRMKAKREAVEALSTAKIADNSDSVPTKVPTLGGATKTHYA